MWRLALSLLPLLFLSAPAPQAAEIGPETFLNAKESEPWLGIGRVNVPGRRKRGMCTGTLIAPDIVLTAAHCLINLRTGKPHLIGTVHFVAGWHKGGRVGHSKAKEIVIHPDFVMRSNGLPRSFAHDIGLIRLMHPIPDVAKPFPVVPFVRNDSYTLIGYRRDRAHALSRQDDCSHIYNVRGVLQLGCLSNRGASGAPIFVITPDGPGIVAVVSAGKKKPPMVYAAQAERVLADLLSLLE